MVQVFETKLGYQRVTSLDLNPSAEQMREGLRAFAKQCRPTDIVAIYHTGHGEVGARGHRLWMGDTVDPVDALVTAELAEKLLDDTPISNLLIILDTCFAGEGGTEALIAGLKAAGKFPGKTVGTITAAHPREQVRAGDFAGLFERAVDHPATGGHEPRYLQPLTIVDHIDSDPERKKWQTVSYSTLLGSRETKFLCNPRYDESFHGLDVATQLQIKEARKRREDLKEFFATAREDFIGREVVLRKLTAWLADKADLRTIVVTGDPGSGKSAVIGQLATLSDRYRARTVPRHGLQPDTIPAPGSIDVAIHARNRGSQEILEALCAAAQVSAATPGDFLLALSGKPMVAALDAIDEAINPGGLVESLLAPLIKKGPEVGFRMLLGTRTHLLGQLRVSDSDTINLDHPDYADPISLRTYARGRLLGVEGSPYRDAAPSRIEAVADAVAAAAGKSFLVAHMVSRSLGQQAEVADPDDSEWRRSLPGTAAQAMHSDLETRLGADAARARDLLLPLAYARGKGLPWENIWAPLASLLAGKEYDNEDLIWLDQNAGSYFVEGIEAGRSVYSLYHAALADYLRQGQADTRVHSVFASFLVDSVPRSPAAELAWPDAHPYVTLHLATHAAEAGELGKVIDDPVYLACADPLGLFAAFALTREHNVRVVGAAYERAVHRLRTSDLADRLSYLELAARRTGATGLAERVAACSIRRRWAVRWIRWPTEQPHRVLPGHRGPVREVVGITAGEPGTRAASVSDDGTLRLWDLRASEPLGMREVSAGGLAAVDIVELPGPEYVAVVLSTIGLLTAHELPSLSQVLAIRASSGWRGTWQPSQLANAEMRCVRLPDGRSVAITAGPGMITSIWDIQAGTPVVRMSAGLRPANVEFRRLVSGNLVVVSADITAGAELVFNLATGRPIPDTRSTSPGPDLAYYCRQDGTPAVGVLSRGRVLGRDRVTVFDLTGPSGETRTIRRVHAGDDIQLLNGVRIRMVSDRQPGPTALDQLRRQAQDLDAALAYLRRQREQLQNRQRSLHPSAEFWGNDPLVRLADTDSSDYHQNSSSAGFARHAEASESFPFTVTLDGRVIVLTPATQSAANRERIVLSGHGAEVTDAATVPSLGRQDALVSSSVDGTVRIWNVDASVESVADSAADESAAIILSTLARGRQTLGITIDAAISADGAVVDLRTGEPVARLQESGGWMVAAAAGWMPDIGDVVVGFGSDHAQIWRLQDGKTAAFFRTSLPNYLAPAAGRLPIRAAYAGIPGRPLAVTCGHDNKAVIWDLVGRRIHNVLRKHVGWTSALACTTTAEGAVLAATGGHDNTVNIWNVESGRRVSAIRIVPRMRYLRHRDAGNPSEIKLVATGKRGLLVLVLCDDGSLRAFTSKNWRFGFRRAAIDAGDATSLEVMQLTGGRMVAVTGNRSGRISVWDVERLSTLLPGPSESRPLIDIETETPITGLASAGDDALVMSGLNGLAAFHLDADYVLDGDHVPERLDRVRLAAAGPETEPSLVV
jgi:WD40 repeat protein